MAIGPGNKITTTGLIDKKPMIPAAPVIQNQQTQQVQEGPPGGGDPRMTSAAPIDQSQERTTRVAGVEGLTDEDKESLDAALSPSVKEALSKIFPDLASAIDQLGTDEPNVIFPLSYIVKFAMTRYGGGDEQEAVNNFMADVQSMNQQMENQNNVPPGTEQPIDETAGLMSSPQDMETA